MRITSIQYSQARNTSFNNSPSFKSQSNDIYNKVRKVYLKDLYDEENYNDAYNTEYEPLDYENYTDTYIKPMELPSQKYFKHQSTFRDEELFDDNTDIKYYYGPEKYDNDDIPVAENLWLKSFKDEDRIYHAGFDTIVEPEKYAFIEAIHSPWITDSSNLGKNKLQTKLNIIQLELTNDKEIKPQMVIDMYKSSSILTNGKMTVNPILCSTAIKILKNSKQWGKTEKEIMNEIKIPIYKNIYGDFSSTKCKVVKACIASDYTNEEILDYLRECYPGYVLDLNSIVTKEDLKDI